MKAHEIIFYNLLLLSAATLFISLASALIGTATTASKIVLVISALITIALIIWANNHKGGKTA